MSDEDKPADGSDNQPTQDDPVPDPKPEGKTFTQDDVDSIVKARLAKERRGWKKEQQAKAQPTPQPTPEPNSSTAELEAMRAKVEALELNSSFAELLSTHPKAPGLEPRMREMLRNQFDPENPEQTVSDIDMLAKANPQAPPAAEPDAVPPNGGNVPAGIESQYQAPGAPAAAPQEPSNDPMTWSKDDIQRLQSDGTFLKRVEEWRERVESGGNNVFRKRVPGA